MLTVALFFAALSAVAEVPAAADPDAAGPYAAILERVTRPFLGKKYLLSPLGEGRGIDPDPRFRGDAFDCTTFVETALALGASEDRASAAALLDQIRYRDGAVGYQTRRHLVEAEWIPDLIALGFVRDVTAELAGDRTRTVELEISEKTWARRRIGRGLKLDAEHLPLGKYRLAYVPLEVLLGPEAPVIPPGTILNVVRQAVSWSPTLVTHQGLVLVSSKGSPFVRHASPVAKRVIDEPLEHMITRYAKRERKWKVVGVNLLQVLPRSK